MKLFEAAGTESQVNRMLTTFMMIHSVEVKNVQVTVAPDAKIMVSVYYIEPETAGVMA
ncbi:hypothetical protein KTT66_08680 [Lacticaseibacillus casei]|jgi:hypothetical protein|uniref:hypothetical protein n=1 Tax=Lacticaseibacillus casei TaxID=1582 RepID=UPI001C385D5A|nr:hypothetical protein [Lacticaseibacillus casei]QXG58274.1 hypothetical protein KTT66_08680 [Lacticaseibacillus casei]